jgi:CheY-like chemotaxis protein
MILIADDFESEIVLLKEVLESLGHQKILIAWDGKQAIELLGNNPIEILITDFNMPYFNGAEVIKVAKEKGVKTIILRSSHSVPTLREKISEANLDLDFEIICKRDFDKTKLRMYLKSILI